MNRLIALFLASVVLGSLVMAQSLADVARKTDEQRRQVAKKASPVYTNKDLKPTEPARADTPTTPPAAGEAAARAAGDGAVASGAEKEAASEEQPKQYTEAEWRTRMADARTELERTRMFADALQSRINALLADFAARDDPAQRAAIETERQRALAELARVKNEIETRTKTIADLEEEARRAGVPPGWLR